MKGLSAKNNWLKFGCLLLGALCLFSFSYHLYAQDLLAGTDSDIKDTMQGTGRNWIYWIDGLISVASFAYTKKPFVFFSVAGVCVFITVLIKIASGGM